MNLTPREMENNWRNILPYSNLRLWNILRIHFYDKKLSEITKAEFLSKRQAGLKSWVDLCKYTNNKK